MMDSLSTVRLVARLSAQCWNKADKIIKLYEEGKIKGQRKVKSSSFLGMPDCKKSNWQFLHGLLEEQKVELLSKIADGAFSFAEADAEAKAWKGRRRYIAIHSTVFKMSSKVPIEQVLASLEDSKYFEGEPTC